MDLQIIRRLHDERRFDDPAPPARGYEEAEKAGIDSHQQRKKIRRGGAHEKHRQIVAETVTKWIPSIDQNRGERRIDRKLNQDPRGRADRLAYAVEKPSRRPMQH